MTVRSCDEIPYLATHEGPSPRTHRALQDVYATVAQSGSPDHSEFYRSEVAALSHITMARSARINAALSPIPDLLLVAVLVTSLVLIGTVSALDTQHRRWHIAITTALCVIVALNFLLIVTLDRPFDGAAKVDDAPLREGIPAEQLRCDPTASTP